MVLPLLNTLSVFSCDRPQTPNALISSHSKTYRTSVNTTSIIHSRTAWPIKEHTLKLK
uniref:Uncharacterized protein n=1 Tax=Anguilla anguilla TaxID=7936 RepID=A0A0E9WQN2_ANGAN